MSDSLTTDRRPSQAQLARPDESLELELERRAAAQAKLEALNADLEARIEQVTRQRDHAIQELEQFVYYASHDLKAPLRAVGQLSVWIGDDLGEAAAGDVGHNLSMMQSRIRRMERMLDDLLEYSRIGRKRKAGDDEHVDANELIEDVLLSAAVPERFTVSVSPGFSGVGVKRMPLQQILLHLVVNAIKHHDRDEGRIEIELRDDGDRFTISVVDDGPGIAPEYHEEIFQMFRTLEPKDKTDSSGIGLAIVRKAVETVGGRIALESRIGAGSRFTVSLPKARVG